MTGEEQAARVAYWRARLASKDGHAERAKAAYRDINLRWPFTFYGVVARARLAEWGLPASIELPAPPAPSSKATMATRSTPPAALARIDELAAAGLGVEAGWELERAEKVFLGGAAAGAGGNPALVTLLLRRYGELENFHRAYQLAESRPAGNALASAPTGGARIWWEAAYPRAHRDLVERFGPQNGNPDLFLYAIMRKESGFSPWDVSTADARGLLQMIPPTSAQVAREAGLDFAADELYQPEVNIRLGAIYIGGLSRKFQGQIPLIAGAYNAGPRAMAKWCDQHGQHPIDEFVELIAFTQTREYAKRVVGIQARYRHLYGPSEYLQPLAVNPSYAATGPDY
jgi:soluble lytic murein transglycosylase